MKTYRAARTDNGLGAITVEENGRAVRARRPRLDLRNHSPTGLERGYAGSGPAQLALALLADHFATVPAGAPVVLAICQDFKFAVISDLPWAGWTLTAEEIGIRLCRLAAEDERGFWRRVIGALDAEAFASAAVEGHGRQEPTDEELGRRVTITLTRAFPIAEDYAARLVTRYHQRRHEPMEGGLPP